VYSSSKNQDTNDPNDVLRDTVIEGLNENIAKLSSAILVWRSTGKGYNAWSSRPETKGKHQLWWSNKRIAISYKSDSISHDENGQTLLKQNTRLMAYNGKDFRMVDIPTVPSQKAEMVVLRKPRYEPEENYLQDVGWHGWGLIGHVLQMKKGMPGREPGTDHWSIEVGKDGRRLIKWEYRNSRTGQIGKSYYDVEKGYGLVCKESYASLTQLQARTTIKYKQVSGGAWFPVDYNYEHFNIQNGEIIQRRKMEIDLGKSAFNDPSAIPEDIFDLEINPNTEVTDYTDVLTRFREAINDI
jgi:hypothetical protein